MVYSFQMCCGFQDLQEIIVTSYICAWETEKYTQRASEISAHSHTYSKNYTTNDFK